MHHSDFHRLTPEDSHGFSLGHSASRLALHSCVLHPSPKCQGNFFLKMPIFLVSPNENTSVASQWPQEKPLTRAYQAPQIVALAAHLGLRLDGSLPPESPAPKTRMSWNTQFLFHSGPWHMPLSLPSLANSFSSFRSQLSHHFLTTLH